MGLQLIQQMVECKEVHNYFTELSDFKQLDKVHNWHEC